MKKRRIKKRQLTVKEMVINYEVNNKTNMEKNTVVSKEGESTNRPNDNLKLLTKMICQTVLKSEDLGWNVWNR